ncbi:Bud20 protein [Saccharomycopsis crataegensis]|uniref:Bud20 protein n=1 Tax=Saccharomycopsis crataegensis TaxID=43959 RepID=A0AAV5QJ81_9ASCO|nr:Bud20 protein [Saccharomycopsis crataegensis]
MGKLTTMRFKTKRRVKNIDQVYGDLSTPESINQLKNQPLQEDKPGLGQHYCVECAKYFQNSTALASHRKGKVHKRRLKLIKEGPYTQLEADAAAGNNLEQFIKKKTIINNVVNTHISPLISLEKGSSHLKKKDGDQKSTTIEAEKPQAEAASQEMAVDL